MAIPTVNEANGDFTHYAVIDFQDLQRSGFLSNLGAANQVKLASIPAGGGVVYCVAYERTAFAGATDITLDVGTTAGDPDEFIDALDVDGMSAPVFNSGDGFTGNQSQAVPYQAETTILAEVNGTTASLTAGNIVIGLRIIDLGSFA